MAVPGPICAAAASTGSKKGRIRIAENHLEREKVDVSRHDLDSIQLKKDGKSGKRWWVATWLPKEAVIGGEIWMSIPMDRDLLPTIERGR